MTTALNSEHQMHVGARVHWLKSWLTVTLANITNRSEQGPKT